MQSDIKTIVIRRLVQQRSSLGRRMVQAHTRARHYAMKPSVILKQKNPDFRSYPAKVNYQSNLKLLLDIGHYWAWPVNLIFSKFHLSKKKIFRNQKFCNFSSRHANQTQWVLKESYQPNNLIKMSATYPKEFALGQICMQILKF